MLKYGELLDDYDIDKENLYSAISEYFDQPDMFKMKNSENCSIYMAKINTMLKNINRYLIAIIPIDNNPIDYRINLKDMKWICFQTRGLEEYHNIPKQNYQPKRESPYNTKISIKHREKDKSDYTSHDFPNINITLLHQKANEYEYPNEGTFAAALETWKTIITID
jgi:hypothetical protein